MVNQLSIFCSQFGCQKGKIAFCARTGVHGLNGGEEACKMETEARFHPFVDNTMMSRAQTECLTVLRNEVKRAYFCMPAIQAPDGTVLRRLERAHCASRSLDRCSETACPKKA